MVIACMKTSFLKNAAVLTVTGLILRFLGIIFKVWLASEIGAEGVGLYQIVFSVYVLAATFATSGICTAVTRLVTEELALGGKSGVRLLLKRCVFLTLVIAAVSFSGLFFGADFISNTILNQPNAALSIKVASVSLPFMGVCSCIRGYFAARRNATPSALSQIFEQLIRIATVIVSLKLFAGFGIAVTLAAVMLGDTVAEALGCLFIYILYKRDIIKVENKGRKRPPYRIFKAVNHIALPITSGRYLNSLLRTAENIISPTSLAKNPRLSDGALSLFGMIKGMALPILFFPSTLISSVSVLLLPEMSEALALGHQKKVKYATEKIIRLTLLVGVFCGAVFLISGDKIGRLLYKSNDVGFLLCALSPIVPLMYLDGICDGILKGLDCQRFTFFSSVGDSALRLIAIPIILPRYGVMGFIGIMYFSNLLTCALNSVKLISVSQAKINVLKTILLPLILALASVVLCDKLFGTVFKLPLTVYIILVCLFSLVIYIVGIFAFKCISKEEIKNVL